MRVGASLVLTEVGPIPRFAVSIESTHGFGDRAGLLTGGLT